MLVIGIEIDKVRVSKYRVRYIINIYILNIYIYIYIYVYHINISGFIPIFFSFGIEHRKGGGSPLQGLETDPEVQRPKFGCNAKLINRQIFLHDASVSFFAVEKPSFDF